MRVLLTGANGQFGTEYQNYCAQSAVHDELSALSHGDFDVTNRDLAMQVLGAIRPDVVIHGGAWTNVDGCELDPRRAMLVNALGTRNIAEAANAVGARVVYISTDYVFDGHGGGDGRAYTEWDSPNPQTVYGRSKLGGERDLIEILGAAGTIVRTSWVVGAFGHNFVKTMIRLATQTPSAARSAEPGQGPQTLTVVNDQWGIPTFTHDLVVAVRELAVRRVPGTFHLSNHAESGPLTWCGFAQEIFGALGESSERVLGVSSAEYAASRAAVTAPRPAFSVLDNIAASSLGIALPEWRDSLQRVVRDVVEPDR